MHVFASLSQCCHVVYHIIISFYHYCAIYVNINGVLCVLYLCELYLCECIVFVVMVLIKLVMHVLSITPGLTHCVCVRVCVCVCVCACNVCV